MNVMLLAAGEGTRLRPYTLTLPKPAIPFVTVPLAGHSLSFLGNLAINKLVVNTYHLPGEIHHLFHSLRHHAKSLHFSDEVGQILGSGGGLGKARDHFIGDDSFVMMNADEIILPKESDIMKKAITHHRHQRNLATLMVMDHPDVGTKFGGVWTDSHNRVLGFGKTPIAGAVKAWHFVGVQILSDKVFDFIPAQGESNILYDALAAGIKKGLSVEAYPFECTWFETGNPTDFLEASEKCLHYLAGPATYQKTFLEGTLKRYSKEETVLASTDGGYSLISKSAFLGHSRIHKTFCAGPGAIVENGCDLTNVIVGANARVPAGTTAKDTLFL